MPAPKIATAWKSKLEEEFRRALSHDKRLVFAPAYLGKKSLKENRALANLGENRVFPFKALPELFAMSAGARVAMDERGAYCDPVLVASHQRVINIDEFLTGGSPEKIAALLAKYKHRLKDKPNTFDENEAPRLIDFQRDQEEEPFECEDGATFRSAPLTLEENGAEKLSLIFELTTGNTYLARDIKTPSRNGGIVTVIAKPGMSSDDIWNPLSRFAKGKSASITMRLRAARKTYWKNGALEI